MSSDQAPKGYLRFTFIFFILAVSLFAGEAVDGVECQFRSKVR
jgi:hypothetical protein